MTFRSSRISAPNRRRGFVTQQYQDFKYFLYTFYLVLFASLLAPVLSAQGVTTGAVRGVITNQEGKPAGSISVFALHKPSSTLYQTTSRPGGAYTLSNLRVGGPYTIAVLRRDFRTQLVKNIFINLGQTIQLNFRVIPGEARTETDEVRVDINEVIASGRTGAATYLNANEVAILPSIRRSTTDLFRLDPRSDGNLSFRGRNWMYNNMTLDGSYYNNAFGLDDPAAGGQSRSASIPFDAIEQVQVSIAPFDIRQSGFTGANINAVTKSGTNRFTGSAYSFLRNENLVGSKISGGDVLNPELSFNQAGFTFGGPLQRNRLFFLVSGEFERRNDPGTNFIAFRPGLSGANVSRPDASTLQDIRQYMIDTYLYDPGPFEGFTHDTNNEKLLAKIDWNADSNNYFTFRYNFLNAKRELPPDPFSITVNDAGRGANAFSLPFRNSGYAMKNELHSFAAELNTQFYRYANRFFFSYSRFRDFREPFSRPFPTIEIAQNDTTLTTFGHEPFSINNRVNQDVWQVSNDFTLFKGSHALTFGLNFEAFKFLNSSNLFYYGLFSLPAQARGTLFQSLDDFYLYTNPDSTALFRDFNAEVSEQRQQPFRRDKLDLGQLSLYFQDEYAATGNFSLNLGLRIDMPMYFSSVPENNFSKTLTLLDEKGNLENLDAGDLPGLKFLLSPRFGFNWDLRGDRKTRLRGGTGLFTGRLPFVWVGNTVSNQGPDAPFPSLNLNATDSDFKWPQIWNTDLAIDQVLPGELLGTFELIYGKDVNAAFFRNANLVAPVRFLPDGRPYFGGQGNNSLNPNFAGNVYVLDNSSDGHLVNLTTQLRRHFDFGLNAGLSYSFLKAKSQMSLPQTMDNRQLLSQLGARSSLIWRQNPTSGNPNNPETSFSQFGNRHRINGSATYSQRWSANVATHVGLFMELADGAMSTATGSSRFSYTYVGDLNGDGSDANDLIYIPRNASEIVFALILDGDGMVVSTPEEQWTALNSFIEQDGYLRSHRGMIAERNGGIHPWFSNIDLRILQDFSMPIGGQRQTFQLSIDVLNLGNLINSDWGVRKRVDPAAKSPLIFTDQFTAEGLPVFQFPGTASKTFVNDATINSRWQVQIGLRYLFN